ncbi:hypothetical protein [Haloferax sp. DFSO52]|uniref:hypothetical protein n=1 Tax=Haloferax sp. DFSO52 TaxID=3388505 RepID=UPI003A87A02E
MRTVRSSVNHFGRWHVVAGCIVLCGLALSTWAASNAFRLGERPVTILPFPSILLSFGVWGLVTARLVAVGVVWAIVRNVAPHYRIHAVAGTGFVWLLWGIWQTWVLLALT